MKAILISIKPKYVAKILNGEKTIEIRKTMPKCDLPIDVYIYCTKEEELFYSRDTQKWFVAKNRKNFKRLSNGVVKAKFTLNKVEKFDLIEEQKYKGNNIDDILKYNECIRKHNDIAKKSCLKIIELVCYCDTKALGTNQKEMVGYAWHIDNLTIFDKPKELSEFKNYKKFVSYDYTYTKKYVDWELRPLTKAPQSWQFIEVEE